MVGVMSFLRKIFSSDKKPQSSVLPPPPAYGQVCPQTLPEKVPQRSGSEYLNPNLDFTARDVEAHLATKDARFAAAAVELMVPRLKLGVYQESVGW
jgi:hypothetical protein